MVAGTTGEAPTLSGEELERLIRFVVEKAGGRLVVTLGAGSNNTEIAVRKTKLAREVGADAVLQVVPYYSRPTQAGLVRHFEQIARVGVSTMIYNIPSRSGTGLTLDSLVALARIPEIVAIKESSGSLELVEELLAETDLQVLSGDDRHAFPAYAIGARGLVSVLSNLYPRSVVELFAAVQDDDLDRARRLHFAHLPFVKMLFLESNPTPLKAALASLGKCENRVRSPLIEVSSETEAAITALLSRVEGVLT